MKTTTSTQVTHYEVQKKRRESLLEEWRGYHKTVLKRKDVVMHDDPHRRSRRGVRRRSQAPSRCKRSAYDGGDSGGLGEQLR